MEDCYSSNHYLISENYAVHSMGNRTKVVDLDILRSGYLTLGSQVIQFSDINSNVKSKELHPLEIEIQKDNELKLQQERLIKNSTVSVIRSPIQIHQNELELHGNVGSSYQFLGEGLLYWTPLNQREDIDADEVLKSTQQELNSGSTFEKQEIAEKNQLLVESEHLNLGSDENEGLAKWVSETNSSTGKSFVNFKHAKNSNMSLNPKKRNSKNTVVEFDSEKNEGNVQSMYDYESGSYCKNKEEQLEKSNKCYMCFKNFRQKKNMYAHIRKIHSIQPKILGGISCPLCKMHALRQEHLRVHLETLHAVPIEKEEKLFNTIEDFFMWKESVEKETSCFYVSKSSSKVLASNQQKTYYKCHRSGNNETHKRGNKNKLNKYESKKIGATCPAAIEMTENSQGINVIFWKTHVGHNNTVDQLVFSKNQKTKIMDYMASGFSWNKILEIIKGVKGSDLSSKVLKEDLIKLFFKKINSATGFHLKKQNFRDSDSAKGAVLRSTSQSSILDKAETLLKIVKTTDIRSDFRPKVCLMIDNLISMIKRRSVKRYRKENEDRGKKSNINLMS